MFRVPARVLAALLTFALLALLIATPTARASCYGYDCPDVTLPVPSIYLPLVGTPAE